MKTLRKILLALGVLLILLVLISFFLPSKMNIERSLVMKGSPENVFEQINTLKNWEQWSSWHKKDPKINIVYEGPASGKDAKYKWTSGKVGNGIMTITSSTPYSDVMTKMEFDGNGEGVGNFKIEARGKDSVKVTWTMGSDMGHNPLHKYMGVIMSSMIKDDFDKGLKSISEIVAKMPAPIAITLNIHEQIVKAQNAVTIQQTCKPAEMMGLFGKIFGELKMFMDKNELKPAGPAFTIYDKYSPQEISMRIGMPTDKPGKSEGNVIAVALPDTKTIMTSYQGKYSGLENAYEQMMSYMKKKNITATGAPWEVYKVGPMMEQDSSKLVTEIYFPIK